MRAITLQESSRDKLHHYFNIQRDYFNEYKGNNLKDYMFNQALKDLLLNAEDIQEYIEELDLKWYNEKVVYN